MDKLQKKSIENNDLENIYTWIPAFAGMTFQHNFTKMQHPLSRE
jgi:hypothetical protein